VTRRSHRLLALSVTLVAAAIAAGAVTARPRLGRERALRAVALAGSTRLDQPCAWGPADDPDPDVAVAAGTALAPADRQAIEADASAVLPSGRFVARAAAARLAVPPEVAATGASAGRRSPPGRAPPVRVS
jgi:hypothetical protein